MPHLLSREERPDSLRRVRTFGRRVLDHPSWAAANVVNVMQRSRDLDRSGWTFEPADAAEALAAMGGWSVTDVHAAMQEAPALNSPVANGLYGAPDGSAVYQRLVYAACRLGRPLLVVETGVARGMSSAAILEALVENGTGHLISIDLPHLHPGAIADVGLAVSEPLRRRWTLRLGPGVRNLRAIARYGPPVDLFAQDGPHSAGGQLAEYRAGWHALRPGGILISDDVGPAFDRFAAEVGTRPLYVAQPPKAEPIGLLRR